MTHLVSTDNRPIPRPLRPNPDTGAIPKHPIPLVPTRARCRGPQHTTVESIDATQKILSFGAVPSFRLFNLFHLHEERFFFLNLVA